MKLDFQNLNLAPSPNPKNLSVERVIVKADHTDKSGAGAEYGFIRNSSLHPRAIAESQ